MSDQTSEKLSDPQNKKIFHYNFSFAYSADKYFLQGTPLSERSSVLQKFINTKIDEKDITFDNLELYRSEIYEKQLEHLKSILTGDNPDYFGLTELIVQMPKENHAYSNHLTKKLTDNYVFPVGKKNEDYGVAKMLIKLDGLIEDKSEVKSVETGEKPPKYDIFYDNILHKQFKFGEGVGMLVKKDLVDKYLEWDSGTRGVKIELSDNDNDNDKKLHFWSTDSGYALDGKNLFKGPTGGSDYGRPFIMTAGLKKKSLRIFSNFHGPNLSNLWYTEQLKNINDGNLKNEIYKTIKNSIEESINKGLENSNLSQLPNVDNINNCEIYFTCDSNDSTGSLLEMILNDGINVKLKINEEKETLFNVKFNYDINNLGKEENEENENTKGLGKYKNIRTCCANCDSIENGRDIKTNCSTPNPIYGNNDNLNDENHFKLHYNNGTVNQIKYTREDSKKNIEENIETYNDGNGNTISPDSNFINPANYGYNGDYSLYGTSNNPPLMKMTIYEGFVDKDHTIPDTEIETPLSDHQGIMSEPSIELSPAEGGKRRRTRRKNKNKNAKKTNKKGKSKKYRKKGRKTRKIRRRK